AGVYLLARFYPAFAPVPGWRDAVIAVGVISALLTAVMALVAPDLKRVLAYSTVSQLGYMVYAVGAGGVLASQFHLFSHAIFKALLFLAAGAVIHAVGTRDMREMGGLGRHMPFTRGVFLLGALALAGLPVLNGFWSKELVLEAGLAGGPTWAFAGMLVGAGLTACYTFRMVWMVFYGTPRKAGHPHDAPSAMRFSLTLLAVGTLTSWLLAGSFGHLLEATLPFHRLHAPGTLALVLEILEAPATWLAMGVILLGLLAWAGRERLAGPVAACGWLAAAAGKSFGFEWANAQVVRLTLSAAGALRLTQPGLLNWNVLGIAGGLVILLVLLALGA
ncbi:MAG: proton-conducting transporter membrane subunit, partial [Candidatus Methylomirabilales bacterium]